MKQLITLVLLALLPVVVSAYDAKVDGIYYDLTGNTATVTSGDTKYSGEVEIPATFTYDGKSYIVVAIGRQAFYSCGDLTSVGIPGNVTSIGKQAFYNCGKLTSIDIPKSVTSIGDYAFYVCQGLKSVTLPENLTAIGPGVFMMCSSLTSITIPKGVASIGNYAFMECGKLTSVVSKVRKPFAFGEDAFYNLPSTCVLTVPRGKRDAYIENGWSADIFKGGVVEDDSPSPNIAFADDAVKSICVANWDTDGDGELSMDEAAEVTDLGTVFKENIEITSFDELQYFTSLTGIPIQAFRGCEELTSIAIPSSVNIIGGDAFEECVNLERVIIPDIAAWCNITFANDDANPLYGGHYIYTFAEEYDGEYDEEEVTEDGLVEVKEIVIPFGITKINDYAFIENSSLESVTIPWGVTAIGDYAFYMNNLKSLTIPGSVTTIGYRAFDNCDINSLTIPSSVTTIGDLAFASNAMMASLTIENGVVSIGEGAFLQCRTLTSVTIPESVTSIGESAFSGCSALTSIEVAAGNTNYDSRDNCNAIIETSSNILVAGCVNTVVPNGITSIGYGAFEGSKLTTLRLPSSVTSIGSYAYAYCDGLTAITIPDNVTTLGDYAFGYCKNLTLAIIPKGVTYIGQLAFFQCSNLGYVVSRIQSPFAFDRDAFRDIPEGCVLIVPKGTRDAYLRTGWTEEVFGGGVVEEGDSPFIFFADAEVRAVCAAHFDGDGDGMLTFDEVAAVTDLGRAFKDNTKITSFKELLYFTNVTQIGQSEFSGCVNLKSIVIPSSITQVGTNAFSGCTSLTDVWCLADDVPDASLTAFNGVPLENATLYVPAETYNDYRKSEPWSRFGTIMTLDGTIPEVKKCATPTISYAGGRLTFNCETEDVKFSYSIKDDDITSGTGNEVTLTVTYNISVYATRDGYDDSDIAYATLCWIDAEPSSEGLIDEDAVAEVKALPVLVQTQGGIISIQGIDEGTQIDIFSIDGKKEGSAIAVGGGTTISTSLHSGSVAIVKIGEKAIKVAIR